MKVAFRSFLIVCMLAALAGWVAFVKERTVSAALGERLKLAEARNKARELHPKEEKVSDRPDEARELLQMRGELNSLRTLKVEVENLRRENQQLRDFIGFQKEQIQAQWQSWVSSVRTNDLNLADVPNLIEALRNETINVRLEATKALRNIGLKRMLNTNLTSEAQSDLLAAAKTAVPALLTALHDSDVMVRANAAITLGFLRAESETVVPALLEALNDPEERVALSAAKGLGRLQSDGVGAIPALLQAVQNLNGERRAAAIWALQQIDPEWKGPIGGQ